MRKKENIRFIEQWAHSVNIHTLTTIRVNVSLLVTDSRLLEEMETS